MKVKVKSLSRVQLFATPWTVAYQAPPSMGLSRQEYWSGCHRLLQGIFPTQGLNPGLLHCRQTLYPLSHQGSPWGTMRKAVRKGGAIGFLRFLLPLKPQAFLLLLYRVVLSAQSSFQLTKGKNLAATKSLLHLHCSVLSLSFLCLV